MPPELSSVDPIDPISILYASFPNFKEVDLDWEMYA